jgi:hypothetical protein
MEQKTPLSLNTTANTTAHHVRQQHPPIASYKGYGWNKTKPPRPHHRNTMIDLVVLGYGPIQMGEGAAAPFNGVHIMGEIWPTGGFDTIPWPNRNGRS